MVSTRAKNEQGTYVTPTPNANESPMMKRLRRLRMLSPPTMEIPDTNTLANKKVVIPPKTESGIEVMTPAILYSYCEQRNRREELPTVAVNVPILEKTPMRISQTPQA